MRLHGLLIEIDLRLQDLAAVRGWHRRAGDGGELRPDEVLSKIEQLHLRQLLAEERKLQDRHAGGIVAEDIRRRDAGRQEFQNGLRGRRHLCQSGGDIYILLEEDLDHAITVQRLRLDVLDIADLCRQRALVIVDHAAGHVVRQQPRVGPDDADDRNVYVRKYVRRRQQRRANTEKRDDDREHYVGVRTP